MKTKKATTNRRKEREADVALLDLSEEFGDMVLDDSFLEEGVNDDDDE